MATGQSIRDKLKKLKTGDVEKPGVLPLVAYYGRNRDRELERGRMYHQVSVVMRLRDQDAPPERKGRELTYAWGKNALSIIDANSSPVEYLVSRGEMETDKDEEGMGGARFHTALRLRDLFDGAQVKHVRSPSLDGVGGGGGAVSAGDIRGYQLDCMKLIEKLRTYLSEEKPWLFGFIEQVVWRDDWYDLKPGAGSQAKLERMAVEREKTIDALHYGLDYVAVILGYAPPEDLVQRWRDGAPGQPPSVRRRIQAATAPSRLALRS